MKVEIVVALGGLGVAMLALAFAAFQTRFTGQQAEAAGRQVKIGNEINGASVTNDVMTNLHDVLRIVVDYPELYPFFYESAPVPVTDDLRRRVMITADMMCTVLSLGLHAYEAVPAAGDGLRLWKMYVDHWLRTCPAVQTVVDQNPGEWHYLGPLRRQVLSET
ncbi:hypothetical protein [Actinomadura sp. DC4]|uniref:hypothetical protein n=1 Tax=Actinomadura sp. DC4 TaxID=3055069 RepID=UPI0025AFDA80|nr:hypothetical protein [Actinomadura sp. DC4]MDN3353162.1 hypothetical protein [Actinomadura sp. DC4]